MRKLIVALLILAGVTSVGLAFYLLVDAVDRLDRLSSQELSYSQFQLRTLIDLAKTLIPTVTGFAVVFGSAAGVLHKQGVLSKESNLLVVLAVFALAVLSLAMWIGTLNASVDCGRPFDTFDSESYQLEKTAIRRLNMTYLSGILAAQLGTILFFMAVDGAAILATMAFGGRAPTPRPSSED